jgi:hypothetical protein
VLLCLAVFQAVTVNVSAQPERLRRADSFLGIHFDFHAGEDCREIGRGVDRDMLAAILDRVQPDYVQCDCKGHPGYSSYPTRAGNPAPGFVKDTLKLWREVTRERGVALYLHYSGVWDTRAVTLHPEWARVDEQGQPDARKTSVYGPYVDRLLIPQLRELAEVYEVDGVWVDGECWATERDYHPEVLAAFRAQTGITEVPRRPEDPHWYAFSEFCREGFRAYLDHYVTTLHRQFPQFQIASNWAYSSMMPESVTVDVDYISGDFSAMDSVNTARLEGRCMVHQGKPWDLMAWSFTWTDGHFSTKTVAQLQREAAVVLALGGGFQAYFPQRRDGSVRLWQMKLMEAVAPFCRARQAYCHKMKPIPQIGLIYSGKAFYRHNRKLFAAWGGELQPLRGILQCLLDGQQVVDIVMEHHLEDRMQDYPLLIFPEWKTIEPDFQRDLLRYVKAGGNLLVIGPDSTSLFADALGVTFAGPATERVNGLEHGGWVAGMKSRFRKAILSARARPFGRVHTENDIESPYEAAASIAPYGAGRIAGVYLDMGERYHHASTTVARDFLSALVGELFPRPRVTVTGSRYVDVTLGEKNGRLGVHLVNTAGPHGDKQVYVHDDIPPVGPLTVTVRMPEKPARVTLQPQGRALEFTYQSGLVSLTVPRLSIYDIVVFE